MKITICGSMTFVEEMAKAERQLTANGHEVFLPEGVARYRNGEISYEGGSEGAKRKIVNDLIRNHYDLIKQSDAILVLNYTKNGAEYYVGGNAFLEMGFAHILNKPIYFLYPIPESSGVREEIEAMQPVIINGDLDKITS